jgi:hypothetical protein
MIDTKIIQTSGNQIINNASIRAREVDPDLSNNRSTVAVNIVKVSSSVQKPVSTVRTGGENLIFIVANTFLISLGAVLGVNSLNIHRNRNRYKI